MRETWTYCRESNKGPPRRLSDWSISPMRKCWENCHCLSCRREGSGAFLQMHVNMWREGAKRFLQWCSVTGPEVINLSHGVCKTSFCSPTVYWDLLLGLPEDHTRWQMEVNIITGGHHWSHSQVVSYLYQNDQHRKLLLTFSQIP